MGQFRIQLSLTTRLNFSSAIWLVRRWSTTASSALRTSLLLKDALLLATVLRKLKATFNLDIFTELASYTYKPGEMHMNFITWPSEICTLKPFSVSVSRVTRNCSVTRAKDKILARHLGLYHTENPPKCPFWLVSRVPPEECSLNISPSDVAFTPVKNFRLLNMLSVDSLSRRIQFGLM